MIGSEELSSRFHYHPPSDDTKRDTHNDIRNYCLDLATLLDRIVPDGREKSLAIANLEQVMFWANAGVVRS